jgi:hypothetical protein
VIFEEKSIENNMFNIVALFSFVAFLTVEIIDSADSFLLCVIL